MNRLLLLIVLVSGMNVAGAAFVNAQPLNHTTNNNVLTVSVALAATGQPVLVINNPSGLEVTALHPASANALAFVLFDGEGVLLTPTLQHKKSAAARMITLKPQSSQTFTLPFLAYGTAVAVAKYSLRPDNEYRLLAIYRPLGLHANGVASAEISVRIKPAAVAAAKKSSDAANTLILHSAINKDQQLALVYSKRIDDCLQLADKNLSVLNSGARPLCKAGEKIRDSQPGNNYLQAVPGKTVMLCNENDITHCSNAVIIKSFADVEGCFDMNGAAVSNVAVTLRPQNGQPETATTDLQGCYSFPDVNLAEVFRLSIDIPAKADNDKSSPRATTSAGGCIYVKDKEISDTRVVIKQDDEANQQLWIEAGGCFDLSSAIFGKRTVIDVSASVQ